MIMTDVTIVVCRDLEQIRALERFMRLDRAVFVLYGGATYGYRAKRIILLPPAPSPTEVSSTLMDRWIKELGIRLAPGGQWVDMRED
jgi:hypothetical protein